MSDFDELMIRIPTEPSVLFLGQEYDAGNLCEGLRKHARSGFLKKNTGTHYTQLSELLIDCGEKEDRKQIVADIQSAVAQSVDDRFKQLSTLRWSGIVTSLTYEAPGFETWSPLLRAEEMNSRFFHKGNPRIAYLYGCAGNAQAELPLSEEALTKAEVNMEKIWDQIAEKICVRGLLVVDGWDPEYDWVLERYFGKFISCPPKTIFFFHLPERVKTSRPLRQLLSKGIAVALEESLFELLQESNTDWRGKEAWEDDIAEDTIEITLDSVYSKVDVSVGRLELSVVNQLDESIHILDDSILENPDYLDPMRYFLRFLSTENEVPLWGAYASGFYFKRDIDDDLLKKVEWQLKNTDPGKYRTILVEGSSASGKSATLGNLAYTLRKQRHYPVIYITSKMKGNRKFTMLANLIRNQFNEKLGAKKTVIIWDGNTYDNDDLYHSLRKYLEPLNVVLIGSRYAVREKKECRNSEVITIPDILSKERELPALRQVLKTVSADMADSFDQILKAINKVSKKLDSDRSQASIKTYSDKGNWFLMIMYQLFEELHEVQRQSVYDEVKSSKDYLDEWMKSYSEEQFLGSSFADVYRVLELEHSDEWEGRSTLISDVYNMIATAGSYGLELPATIVYRTFFSENSGDWGAFSKELDKNSILRMTQYEDGTLTLRFRRALMASLFLEKQVMSNKEYVEDALLDLKVQSLIKIVERTNFNNIDDDDPLNESVQVLNLVRKFGPNGPENQRYKEYYLEIADALDKTNEDINDEATLVASHLIREGISNENLDEEKQELILSARRKLRSAINKRGVYDRPLQISRLKVELCSNLERSMGNSTQLTAEDQELFKQINQNIDHAIKINFNRFSAGTFFKANFKIYHLLKDAEQETALSRMLQIADDISESSYEEFGDDIHNYLLKVWEIAGKYQAVREEQQRLLEEDSDVGIYREAILLLKRDEFGMIEAQQDTKRIQGAMEVLEAHKDVVLKNNRSLWLYIRLLWMRMTGKPPFTEKQRISLAEEEWSKLSGYCKRYISQDEDKKKAFPYFINMIYSFRRGSIPEYKEMLETIHGFTGKMPAHVTFAVLCDTEGKPVREDIRIKRAKSLNEVFSAEFIKPQYKGVDAYFKLSNFKDILEVEDGRTVKNALIGFNMYGVVVYGERDLKLQSGGNVNE